MNFEYVARLYWRNFIGTLTAGYYSEKKADATNSLLKKTKCTTIEEAKILYQPEAMKQWDENYSRVNNQYYVSRKSGLEQSKNALGEYMKNPDNNGKKLFQRVIEFFAPENEKASLINLDKNESTKSYTNH